MSLAGITGTTVGFAVAAAAAPCLHCTHALAHQRSSIFSTIASKYAKDAAVLVTVHPALPATAPAFYAHAATAIAGIGANPPLSGCAVVYAARSTGGAAAGAFMKCLADAAEVSGAAARRRNNSAAVGAERIGSKKNAVAAVWWRAVTSAGTQ